MDIIRLNEIRNRRDVIIDLLWPFRTIELLNNYEFEKELEFLNHEIYTEWLVECSEFVKECKNWLQLNSAPYKKHVLLAIEEFVKLSVHEMDFLFENIHKNTSDFLIDLPSRFGLEGRDIIDYDTGYPINRHYVDDILRDCQNPKYDNFIRHVSQLHDLLIISLTNVLEEAKIEDMESESASSKEVISQLNIDGHKLVLLHELGIIEFLRTKYYTQTSGISDLANLLSAITNLNAETIRKGITEYKLKGKRGNVFTGNAIKNVNKVLLDVKIPPLEHPDKDI